MLPVTQGLGIDLELGRDGQLTAVGAIRGTDEFRRDVRGARTRALAELDAFAAGAPLLFGHNVLWHDLPWLAEHAGHLALLRLPVVDTLALSAIAFAEHPYHRLVKDYKLVASGRNNPVHDARLAAQVLADAIERLRSLAAANPPFARVLRRLGPLALQALSPQAARGIELVLEHALGAPSAALDDELRQLLAPSACRTAVACLLPVHAQPPERRLALLFAVAWLRVAGLPDAPSASIVMPWARRQIAGLAGLLRLLRDTPCSDDACAWCRSVHDPERQLARWFGYAGFRAEPALPDGRAAQRAIVEAGFADQPLLALLPTGGGKSLCFQLPAIQRYLRRGCLTVVISPLQALMHDQVAGFRQKTGLGCAFALTGALTPPERRDVLDAVRSGPAGIVYVSPEQLRNVSFDKALASREIGAWVFDEAHCLSQWGHDFRPDYLYAARFVREFSERHRVAQAPIVCVTATAKPDVRDEILAHFRDELGQELAVLGSPVARKNLELLVESVTANEKVARLRELLAEQHATAPAGSAIVYTATRRSAEEVAARLRQAGIDALAFHAGLEAPQKQDVQARFLSGDCRVVCATNAFGMGIDKPDVRLVVHHDVPGSLEAYVQEVGRAGRDGQPARAVLLFAEEDIETQFRLAASSRLDARDLRGILRRVRRLSQPTTSSDEREAVCTPGEILQDDELAARLPPHDRNAPTRVQTAIAWLERGRFLRRDENATTVFQGSPRVKTLEEAEPILAGLDLPAAKAQAWRAILNRLLAADVDEGLRADDFLALPEVLGTVTTWHTAEAGRAVLRLLSEMQQARLLTRGVHMTAFVRHGIARSSRDILQESSRLELAVLDLLRAQQPDASADDTLPLSLPVLGQELAASCAGATADRVRTVLESIADRSGHAGLRAPGVHLRFQDREHCTVQLRGSWDGAIATAKRRHAVAGACLSVLLRQVQTARVRGGALLVEFLFEDLQAAIDADLELRSTPARDPAAEIEHALLFLHRIGAIVLHKGLAVFRQAMTLRLPAQQARRPFTQEDFAPLAAHQAERTVQIHTVHEFARRMLEDRTAGLRLLDDYFGMPAAAFRAAHLAACADDLKRPTTAASYAAIVDGLSREQRRIVEAAETRSLLVLAGPGSGKTRVVVHRCAWLVRVRRVPARSILVLCFNRSAALELRRRLRELIGDDARGVLVQTYHGMAARLAGRSPALLLDQRRRESATAENEGAVFHEILAQAIALLETPTTAAATGEHDHDRDDVRERLLGGFRHILVDEYQDIDEQQSRLVAAIAGRQLADPDRKLTVLAVGDDDQNIYTWRGSHVRFLRRFEDDYRAERVPLLENYRSTAHILDAANQVIAPHRDRLKAGMPVHVDAARRRQPAGGPLAATDAVGGGRVRVLATSAVGQPFAVRGELLRLQAVDPQFAWSRCAVLSPRHAPLDPVREVLERAGIPVCVRVDARQAWSLYRLREVQQFLDRVDAAGGEQIDAAALARIQADLRAARPRESNLQLVDELLGAWCEEHGAAAVPRPLVREFVGELLLEQRRERRHGDGVLLGTVHGSKGAEYDHVVVLGDGWRPRGQDTEDDLRRLCYVAMTRARRSLTLLDLGRDATPWLATLRGDCVHRADATGPAPGERAPTGRRDLLGMQDVYLAFAGASPGHERIDAAIADLCTGDPLQLLDRPQRLLLADGAGRPVGALSQTASDLWRPRLTAVAGVRVAAILRRQRQDEGDEWQQKLRRQQWFVVLPEIHWQSGPSTPR
jgi:ATP-dependent DNA helicase RecQ